MWEDEDEEEEEIILPHTPKGKEAFKKLEWWQEGIQCFFSENELEFLFRHFIIYAEIEKDKNFTESKSRNTLLLGYKKNLKVILQIGLENYAKSGLFQFFSAKYELLFGSVNKAIEDLFEAKIYDPFNQEIAVLLSSCYEKKGLIREAIDSILVFEKTGEPLVIETYVKLLDLLYYNNEVEQVVVYLKKIVKSDLNDELMRIYDFDFEIEDMVKALDQLLEEDPFNAKYWVILGGYHHLLENYNEAIDAYEYAYFLNDKAPATLLELGIVNKDAGLYEKAIDWFNLALENPAADSPYIKLQIAICLNRTGEYEKARMYLTLLNKNDDILFDICTEMAYSYLEDESPKKALPWLEKALGISHQIPVYVMIAEAHYQLNDFEASYETYKDALLFAENYELDTVFAFFFGIFYRSEKIEYLDKLLDDFKKASVNWVRPEEEYVLLETIFKAMIFRFNGKMQLFQTELLHCFVLNAESTLAILEKIDLELLEDSVVISIKDLF
jgi:tetratricopeptide (TPR) repeat protein